MGDDVELDDAHYQHEHEHDNDIDIDADGDGDGGPDGDGDPDGGDDEDDDNDNDDDDDDDDDDEDDDEDDEEEDDEDDEDDEDEDEDDTGSLGALARGRRRALRTAAATATPSPSNYLAKAHARRRLFHPPPSCISSKAYQIEPMAAAPHGCQVHAMALSRDSNCLLSAGSDGFIRRYDLHATMNGKSMLTQNVRHGFVEGITRGGVLSAWWPNQEVPPFSVNSIHDRDRPLGVVHSLACQSDALWGVSGSESGNIHLWGIRHDVGETRHVFRKHKGAVSVLTLASDDTELVSGGWDLGVHQWDLHTGQIARSYPGHAGQVSSISFRPIGAGSIRADDEPTRSFPLAVSRAEKVDGDAVDPVPPVAPRARKAEEDPTEEELIFEAELNASLGLAPGDKRAAEPVSMEDEVKPRFPLARKEPSPAEGRGNGDGAGEGAGDSAAASAGAGTGAGAGADEDLFGGDTPPSTAAAGDVGGPEKKPADRDDAEQEEITTPKGSKDDSDGDDSLFGDDGDEEADGEMDADADADADEDADRYAERDDDDPSSDEDMPLAGRSLGFGTHNFALPGRATETPDPSSSSTPTKAPGGGSGVALPFGTSRSGSHQSPAPLPTPVKVNGASRQRTLPKPSFGGFSAHSGFDDDVSTFSSDVMLTSTLAGQVLLWDSRVKSITTGEGTAKGVRALGLPDKTPPWCASACFNATGDRIFVGRRNESVDEWDMRMLPDTATTSADGLGIANPRFYRSLKLPTNSGPVTAVAAMPNGRHIICGSYDNVRLWNTYTEPGDSAASKVPFRIVAGHHGAAISQIVVDPTCSFLLTASGDRGWMSSSTEALIVHEIKPV